jgi:hypothetical protein
VLRSVDENARADISDVLKTHIVEVLQSAARITANPHAIAADTLPEAIELAYRIQGNQALRQRLEQLTAFDAIQPEVAKDILRSLRPIAA